jgi:glycosyltransferase involved in cell wall biosynthesis
MRIGYLLPEVGARAGGTVLSASRLLTALAEGGHTCELIASERLDPAQSAELTSLPVRRLEASLFSRNPDARDLSRFARELAAAAPDLLIVSHQVAQVVDVARRIAPTVYHAHISAPVCADATRYWNTANRPCMVTAGRKCAVIRPVMGCSGRRQALDLSPVRRQRMLLEALRAGGVGVVAVSGEQAALFLAHGLSAERVTVIPNLGVRADAGLIATAMAQTPPQDRSLVAYFGRLTKEKGARLLPALAASVPDLAVFGDGYLRAALRSRLGPALRGEVTQERVTGVLSWARAVVFPSLWPEPGGIVGIDAQLFGVPLASFDVGAAREWPATELFAHGDVHAMATWLARRDPLSAPRDPESIAARQAAYWSRVGGRAALELSRFLDGGAFTGAGLGAVRSDLAFALEPRVEGNGVSATLGPALRPGDPDG